MGLQPSFAPRGGAQAEAAGSSGTVRNRRGPNCVSIWDMTALLSTLAILAAAQFWCGRLARRGDHRLMRPADQLDADDVDCWLDLIEPYTIPDSRSETRS